MRASRARGTPLSRLLAANKELEYDESNDDDAYDAAASRRSARASLVSFCSGLGKWCLTLLCCACLLPNTGLGNLC